MDIRFMMQRNLQAGLDAGQLTAIGQGQRSRLREI